MRTNELNGKRTVSHPFEPDVVVLVEVEMIVDSGGTSESAAGRPVGYNSSTASGESAWKS